MLAMARVAILGAIALGFLHRASAGRPKFDSDALEPAGGVHMLAGGGFVKDSVPSTPQLKSAAASLLSEEGRSDQGDDPPPATPPASGSSPPGGGGGPPVGGAASPAAAPAEEPYKITEQKYRPTKPSASEIPTKSTLSTYPAPWKDAKGAALKASNTYEKVRSKMIDGENLIFSKDFDIARFSQKGEAAFVKNVEYHKALQKYVENLFKMSQGAHAVTEKEFKDQDKRSKAIESELSGENIDVDNGLPPAPAAAAAAAPGGNTPPGGGNSPPPGGGGNAPQSNPPQPGPEGH